MKMTDDVILARQLRLATISNLVGQGILDEPSAKELLSGPLEPGNESTIVDDSALLGDPEALIKIAAQHRVQRIGGEAACWGCGAEVGGIHEEYCPNDPANR